MGPQQQRTTLPGPVTVRPATSGRFDDVAAVMGTRGAPSWCWCQFFLTTGEGYTSSAAANREALRSQLASRARDRSRGLVAYVGDEPVGWVQLGPRTAYPRITRNRSRATLAAQVGDDLAADGVWSVTCFVVKVGRRRQGVAAALLDAAIDHARASGARVLEGHPVDVAAKPDGRAPGADLYHGVASTFAGAGFVEVGRTAPARPVMRLTL
jgi:GNAT superfamily N-acetyltransferase